MDKHTTKKISRRIFNIIIGISSFFGFSKTKVIADTTKDSENYMEVLIIPEEFRYPYSPKIREVLFNHKKSGKTNQEIKDFIISQCKVIKVPIK